MALAPPTHDGRAPSTPTRRRVFPSATSSAQPSPTGSPAFKGRVGAAGGTTASPQVKAALAALRKKRATATVPTQGDDSDPFTDSKVSSNGSSSHDLFERATSSNSTANVNGNSGGDGIEWGVKSMSSVLDTAKRTGRLNVASRGLTALPAEAFSTMIPLSSPFHPSNRPTDSNSTPPSSRASTSTALFDDPASVEWYSQENLKWIVAGSNEIVELPEEIAGFEDLELLDLHNNLIAALPSTFHLLKTLTSLNLASNELSSFPTPLLALSNLKDLNLSGNSLSSLWPAKWQEVAPVPQQPSPSATPESAKSKDHGTSFWDSFPSSPSKRATSSGSPGATITLSNDNSPFPRLTKLLLSANPLSCQAFADPTFTLPLRLTTLDLSDCRLTAIPLSLLKPLAALETLDLSGNHLIADFLPLGPFQPNPSASGAPLLPSLAYFDLSRTPLETLGPLDNLLNHHIQRPVEWVGLPKIIANLVRAAEKERGPGRGGRKIEVRVLECPLREERERRRREFNAPSPAAVPEPVTTATMVENGFEDVSAAALGEAGKQNATIATVEGLVASLELDGEEETITPRAASPSTPSVQTPPSTAELDRSPAPVDATQESNASPSDPAVVLVTSNIDSVKRVLDLSKQSLSDLPTPLTGSAPSSVRPTGLDLSQNVFQSLPLEAIATWKWSSTLSSLSFSRNRLSSTGTFFPHLTLSTLTNLDLSSNRLTSTSDSQPLLSLLASIAPSLTTLDLSHNFLTDTSGIGELLLPPPGAARKEGLKELKLVGNKISDLKALCAVAEDCEAGRKQGWRCEILDLTNNEIARLPPTLGLLPHTTGLLIKGNTFRIPRREVYENGGSRGLLEWLKDRC